jgi:hypothetical protein
MCMVHVHYTCCLYKSKLHDLVHAAYSCPCPCCMTKSRLHDHVHVHCAYPMSIGQYPCPLCISMTMVHVHVHGVCPCPWLCLCPWTISISLLHVNAHVACQTLHMLHVHFYASWISIELKNWRYILKNISWNLLKKDEISGKVRNFVKNSEISLFRNFTKFVE